MQSAVGGILGNFTDIFFIRYEMISLFSMVFVMHLQKYLLAWREQEE